MGQLPGGRSIPWDDGELSKHLREQYIFSDVEEQRQIEAKKRLDLFRDQGEGQLRTLADKIFMNDAVREWRKRFIEIALFQNITKRIIREVSSVYAESAKRRVDGNQEAYDKLQQATDQDRRLRKLNQYVNLLNECFLWFDVDEFTGDPRIRVVTPDKFWAVSHPQDATRHVATIIRQFPQVSRRTHDMPHYLVLAEGEFFRMDGRGFLMPETRAELGIDGMPGMLVHRSLPEERLLDHTTGKDLISAHLAVALINTLLLKQQKSGTRQAFASGDTADMPSGQPMDEEHILSVPEGVSLSVLDMGADPSNYIEAARFIIKQVAANWGMPESVFDLSYQATSGFEIELKRTALREIRRDQILDYRPVERELARIQSDVLGAARHELAFAADGWRIDFGEVESPLDPMQDLVHFEKRRKLGLTNTIERIMHENPEFSEDDALELLMENVKVESIRVEMMRALNMSPVASSDDPGQDPEENGDEEESEEREAAVA